jgi:hypothetical protein
MRLPTGLSQAALARAGRAGTGGPGGQRALGPVLPALPEAAFFVAGQIADFGSRKSKKRSIGPSYTGSWPPRWPLRRPSGRGLRIQRAMTAR